MEEEEGLFGVEPQRDEGKRKAKRTQDDVVPWMLCGRPCSGLARKMKTL
jgi:hypothetical protein